MQLQQQQQPKWKAADDHHQKMEI